MLKQGTGNKPFQERWFELVTLGGGGEYGAFLVYYESELKAHLKGYISLQGATASTIEHATEPYCIQLTTPARRLSVLTPGVAPGPLKDGSDARAYDMPPSLDSKMNILQKLDNWGKNALRNAMASGPLDRPVTTWTLAATSAAELDGWMSGFARVLSHHTMRAEESADGYGDSAGSTRGASPVTLQAEEVM
jgi:hypothetical protein